jgi:hypothetical protein
MKTRITEPEAAAYRELASRASAIQSAINDFTVAMMGAGIPDTVKIKIMDRMSDKPSFQSLAYFLTPQTEWTGGDSLDDRNHVTMNPHIAR